MRDGRSQIHLAKNVALFEQLPVESEAERKTREEWEEQTLLPLFPLAEAGLEKKDIFAKKGQGIAAAVDVLSSDRDASSSPTAGTTGGPPTNHADDPSLQKLTDYGRYPLK